MELSVVEAGARTLDEFGHAQGRLEGRRRLEDNAQALSFGAERFDVVGQRLVRPPMTGVLLRVLEELEMELPEVAFGEVDGLPVGVHHLHRVGIARDLLCVPGGERPDVDVREQLLDLAVRECGALYPGRGADALDGRDAPEAGQPVGRDPADGLPGPFELVDFGDEAEQFVGGDRN